MLRFFRQIRQRLLTDNKFSKYLLYAVGEILLVVIGILIALQVNNWNEERIGAENTKVLFQQVNNELLQNMENIDRSISNMIEKDSLYFKVLTNNVKYQDYKSSDWLFVFPFLYNRTSLSNEDFNALIEGKDNLTGLQDSIFSELKDLYGIMKKTVDENDETQHNTQLAFRDILKNEFAWFSSFHEGILTDEMIQYALTDPYYRNQLHEMRWREFWQTKGMLWFRTKALNLYREIAHMLQLEMDMSLSEDFKSLQNIKGVYEFKEYHINIDGNDKLEWKFILNGTELERNIHSYTSPYLIVYGQEHWQINLAKIEFGEEGEVIGFTFFGDMDEENGKRIIAKKIH